MDYPASGGEGPSSSGSQRKAQKRPRDPDEDPPSSRPEKSACPPAQPEAPGPDLMTVIDNITSTALAQLQASYKARYKGESTDYESPAEGFRESSRGKPAELVSPANLKRLRGRFTGATLDYQLPCTAAEGKTCQIFGQLSAWNEFLCQGFLQLRETSGTAGNLALVLFCKPSLAYTSTQQLYRVATLVHWLLKTHRCVGYVELDVLEFKPYCHFISDALQGNSHVRRLKLTFGGSFSCEDVAPDILSLSHLEELEYKGCLKDTPTLVSKLPTFLRTATSLRALRISGMSLKDLCVEDFFRALGENPTLKELTLPDSVVPKAPPTAHAAFAESLKNSTSLKTLSFAADPKVYSSLKWILEGLLENKSVASVDFKGLAVDRAAVQLMSNIFTRNKVLRIFKMSCESRYHSNINSCLQEHPTKADFDCLLKALVSNDTLEQVALPLEFWDAEQWKVLFEALPSKRSLKMVSIEGPDRRPPLLPKVCAALRETEADEKVSFKAEFVVEALDDRFTCKAFSKVVVYANDCNRAAVCRFLERLPSLGHITSLHLDFDFDCGQDTIMSSAVTAFMGATRTLKTLTLGAVWDVSLYDFQEAIMKGLALNTSLRELRIQVGLVKMEFSSFAKPLADAINASRNISRVHFNAGGELRGEHAFFQRLSMDVANNYTLLGVNMPESVCKKTERYWFKVCDATRRNSDLVTGAADFARGARRDRHCALALEQVHGHPELVEEVARLESVDEPRAAAMVRDGLQSMEGMHDFMRLAGVVKEWVTCHGREDGRMQLDDLNEHCWSAVRSYLKLWDIGDSTRAVPSCSYS